MEQTVRHPLRPSPTIREALKNPQTADPVQRSAQSSQGAWNGLGEAWSYLSTVISGVVVWGAIGYGLDKWLGTEPVLFVIGALVGNFAGIYLVYLRAFGPKRPADEGSDHRAP
jgi:F0F1-type ATP synthase assembly protein I